MSNALLLAEEKVSCCWLGRAAGTTESKRALSDLGGLGLQGREAAGETEAGGKERRAGRHPRQREVGVDGRREAGPLST